MNNSSNHTTLIIDADDTLWENNVYFEEAIASFTESLRKESPALTDVEEILREKEKSVMKKVGYGSGCLCETMMVLYREICEKENRAMSPGMLRQIEQSRHFLKHHDIVFLDGVEETLPLLRKRNTLILLTKGNESEQMGKINRSGMSDHFHYIRIVPEKDPDVYHALVSKLDLSPDSTWMIGNSPRSDINPAKAAGLGTVLIPYHATWIHEMEEVSHGGRETIVVKSFSELARLFG